MTTKSTGTGVKRAGESDIEKIIRMVKEKLSKIKAKDVGALPETGGTLSSQDETILSLKRNVNGDVFIEFKNSSGVSRKLGFNIFHEMVATNKEGAVKKVLLSGDAIPVSGGTVGTDEPVPFYVKNDGGDDTAIGFKNKGVNLGNINMNAARFQVFANKVGEIVGKQLLLISDEARKIYDYKSKTLKEIVVDTKPTFTQTKLLANNGGIKIYGNDSSHDITNIFVKANTMAEEGMILGVTSNRMGYIIGQNFNLDCTKLTDSERITLQSFNRIIIHADNNSVNYPTLVFGNINLVIASTVRCKTGYKVESTKVTVTSNGESNEVMYDMPASFRQDDNSQNNLAFSSNEWVHHIGVNIKDY